MNRMSKRTSIAAVVGAAGLIAAASLAPTVFAEEPDPTALQAVDLVLTQVAVANTPTAGTPGPDGSIWIAERAGVVRVLDENGLGSPVLDISDEVSVLGEGGLLGLAFDPDLAHFYVSFTGLDGGTNIDEFAVADGQLLPDTRRSVFTHPQPFSNHNGGNILFGPDNLLYIGLGDGGGSGDPQGNGQDLGTLLGTILRIDPHGAEPYAIPADNPFVDDPNARDEIWAYGLRNPWRFAFDAETGELWTADVGQNLIEEVNLAPAGVGGQNYGWSLMEGTMPFNGEEPADHHAPIFEYDNDGARCAITGGYVYRGEAIPDLQGAYLFSDYCEGDIRALEIQDGEVIESNLIDIPSGGTFSFVQGPDLEIYVLDGRFGNISRIDPAEGPDPDPTDPDPTDPDPTDPDPTDPTDPTGDACTATINIVSDWGSGWQGNVTVTAVEGLDNWSLQWTWPGDQAITSHWNADLNTTGTSVTATDVGWNGTIAAGQSLEVFGFIATGAGSAPQITCTTA
nr:PQQ-dependent sugar dehydrogenase [Glycomyces sp. NRRL B-16210]